MIELKRGVLVDYQGYFLGALQWDAAGAPPNFNVPRRGQRRVLPADRKHLLTEDYAVANVTPDARWDFTPVIEGGQTVRGGTWLHPSTEIFLADNKGAPRGRKKIWPARFAVPFGLTLVEAPPPKSRSRRPIWDGAAWRFPRRVALVDANGVVQEIHNENPRADQPDVQVPNGWSRHDDRALPMQTDGKPIQIGSIFDPIMAEWLPPHADGRPAPADVPTPGFNPRDPVTTGPKRPDPLAP